MELLNPSLKNEKKIHPEKISYSLRLKNFLYFFKRKLFLYFCKWNPALFSPSSKNKNKSTLRKFLILRENGTF